MGMGDGGSLLGKNILVEKETRTDQNIFQKHQTIMSKEINVGLNLAITLRKNKKNWRKEWQTVDCTYGTSI